MLEGEALAAPVEKGTVATSSHTGMAVTVVRKARVSAEALKAHTPWLAANCWQGLKPVAGHLRVRQA